MTTTQQPSRVPMCTATRTATGSAQWLLEMGKDANTPAFRHNNLELLICGQAAFSKIAEDLRNAKHSIDIVCWGFDPAMELTRDKGDTWPRGDTWGGLLKTAAAQGVQVRLLVWYDTVGNAFTNNVPGYKKGAPYELKAAAGRGMARATAPGGRIPAQPEPTEPQDRREVFNSHWYRDVVAGAMDGISLRTRGGVHQDVLSSLKGKSSLKGESRLGFAERLGMELVATHHQKTIVIDYEGENPCGYVMGLNSVTDYWDTTAHRFHEPLRGASWEGHGEKEHATLMPLQDYACRIQGEALVAVCKNFTEAWNKADASDKGAGSNVSRSFDFKEPPKNLTRNLKFPRQQAHILRTLPSTEGSEKSIHRLYSQAGSFARHYIYVENQYFQHAGWVKELKQLRVKHFLGCQSGGLPMAEAPKLHVMAVIPTPERSQMVPRTHDTVAELAHGSSMPNQAEKLGKEIARYEADLKAHEQQPTRFPPPRLSDIARTYKEAGGGRGDDAAREELEGQYGMRSLVASLWTWDPEWSESKFPVFEKARQEKAAFDRAMEPYRKGQLALTTAYGVPRMPPSRKKEMDKAREQRYREIYIHSKLMISDDSIFTLGSANLNVRSFAVDSEINIASDDPATAKKLRQDVWDQHTMGQFGGGNATDQKVMTETFKDWKDAAKDNLQRKSLGKPLSCFLVAFRDERTSSTRWG